jgi:hypothetical protein
MLRPIRPGKLFMPLGRCPILILAQPGKEQPQWQRAFPECFAIRERSPRMSASPHMFVQDHSKEELRSLPDRLFVPQSDHRVDAHGASRRNVARRDGHNNQQHSDAGKGQRVMRTHTEELVGHQTRQS